MITWKQLADHITQNMTPAELDKPAMMLDTDTGEMVGFTEFSRDDEDEDEDGGTGLPYLFPSDDELDLAAA